MLIKNTVIGFILFVGIGMVSCDAGKNDKKDPVVEDQQASNDSIAQKDKETEALQKVAEADSIQKIKEAEAAKHQTEPIPEVGVMAAPEEEVMTFVEQQAEFPGGENALYSFLNKHIQYPPIARENQVEGRVEVFFTIEKDGSVSNIHVKKEIGWGLDKEAMRVVKLLPKWKPAKVNGKPIKIKMSLPVKFAFK